MIPLRANALAIYLAYKFGLPLAVAWGAIWGRRFLRRRKHEAAQGWSSVEGTILYCKVTPIPKTTVFVATMTYSYFVEEYRAGEYEIEFSREDEADEFARSVKDRRLQIRYKPGKPDVSTLDESAIAQLSPVRIQSQFGTGRESR